MLVLSIDIGIVNLGFVFANIDAESDSVEVIKCNRVDITYIRHNRVSFCDCKLHHEYCIPDYLDHFIQENEDIFTEAEIILIERQPPVGITNVQDLLFKQFRHKVILISPNTIHSYFGMSSEYDTRKQQSEAISKSFLHDQTNFKKHIRKHDISDALLFVLYHYNTLLEHHIDTKMYTKATIDFEHFRFKGSEGT